MSRDNNTPCSPSLLHEAFSLVVTTRYSLLVLQSAGSNSFLRLKHTEESCLIFTEHKERLKLIWVERSYKLLEFIQTKLLFHTLEDMRKYVLDQRLYNQNSSEPGFSEEQCELLFQLSKSYNLDIPDTFSARPPNSTASLLHW